jgi:ubiquinone/menaquinone biosynthesis C-methylase UbiE
MGDADIEYYQRRADEYDATSWEHPDAAPGDTERVRILLNSLPAVRTVDVGCGTGYLSRWLPGQLTVIDASLAMLSIARNRLPNANLVRARAPQLPLGHSTFGRAFTANLYGHLAPAARSELVREMLRVASEVIVLDQLANADTFSEGPEQRKLMDGSVFTIHKCYFTLDRLLEELGGGEILMAGPVFGIIRRLR